jgi:hypothetical protein
MTLPLAYVATPYSHPDVVIRNRRYEEACKAAKALAMQGKYAIYSPIAHWHPIAVACGMPTDAMFWKEQNFGIMTAAHAIIVVKFDGWISSMGVDMEITFAKQNNKVLIYTSPETFDLGGV